MKLIKLKDLMAQYGEYTISDELIEKLQPPEATTIWDLPYGDTYYYIDTEGNVTFDAWYESCKGERDVGNVFLTEEEALKDVERRKVETLLLRYNGRRWYKDGKENWFVTFDRSVGFLRYVYTVRDQRQGTIYFDTEKQARQAVKDIGEEKIKSALFEVK